jgi:hypothetical protein
MDRLRRHGGSRGNYERSKFWELAIEDTRRAEIHGEPGFKGGGSSLCMIFPGLSKKWLISGIFKPETMGWAFA